MEYKGVNLQYKRFRSKASSAASLSPGRLVSLRTKGFDFLRAHYYDTVSRGERDGVRGDGCQIEMVFNSPSLIPCRVFFIKPNRSPSRFLGE